MKMTQLIRYDVPPEVVALWQRSEGETLLPLQERVVRRHGLFDGGNLLVQAPTSSGKTFIGEMAAIQTALRRKRVVYLVPLKALAEEKYRDFQAKYADYGLKVVVSTRDHREFDGDLERGDFAIAVVVYEKLAQMLVRRPEGLEEIALIIADELEILSDPERGAMAELLLTRIVYGHGGGGEGGCRLIGLSAVIGEAERLAEWMNAQLAYHEQRPVELRYGVLHEGRFRYRTYNEAGEGEEALEDAPGEPPWEVLMRNVAVLTARGESCLIFVKSKHESRRGAELLAQRVQLPAAEEALEALRDGEGTRARDCLLDTLSQGVGFHNADLAPEERRIVEEAFRAGEVKVIVSTSTLAVGLNLPARNVFLTAEKWQYDRRLDVPWKTPILHAEYENMGGRAGRYGAGHEYGRAILIATTPFDEETLWRRYVEGEREAVVPRLAREPLDDHVLRLVASRFCRERDALLHFLEHTLSGQWVWAENYTVEEIAFRIHAAVNRCVDVGMLVGGEDGRLEATPFGLAAASKGISIETARELAHWIGASETRGWHTLDLLFAAASTPDGRMPQVMLTAREYERAGYPALLKERTRGDELEADVPINRIRNCNLMPFFEEVRAIKIALLLEDWIGMGSLRGLEESYNTMAGQILSAADQAGWIIDATAAIATALGAEQSFIEGVAGLAECVQHGVCEELLPLARLDVPGFTRNSLAALHTAGYHTPEALCAAPEKTLAQWLPEETVGALKTWAARKAAPASGESGGPEKAVLVIDERRPGEIIIDGVNVPLQDKQYRLIQLLAANPGVCVPYDRIYEALWGGEVVVYDAQLHQQKKRLLSRIQAAVPARAHIVTTTPKRGFTLDLKPGEVRCKTASVSSAA